jgi:thiamine-monophosphate kinase
MKLMAYQFHCDLIGGDTSRSEKLSVSLTLCGTKPKAHAACRRADAQAGDYIYVSGTLGGSRAGLEILLGQRHAKIESENETFIARHNKPSPRVDLGQILASELNRVAVIDISDSLYHESQMISAMSAIKMEINLDTVPLFPGLERLLQIPPLEVAKYALFSGEEYELLFTCATNSEELQRLTARHVDMAYDLTCIGRVAHGSQASYAWNGVEVPILKDQTFTHFASGQKDNPNAHS